MDPLGGFPKNLISGQLGALETGLFFFFPPSKKTKVGFLAFWVNLVLICIPLTCLGLREALKCL